MKNHYRHDPAIKSITLALMLAYLVLVWVCKDSAKPEALSPHTEYAHFKSGEASRHLNGTGVKNLSSGVESRHAELPCKHGDLAKDGLKIERALVWPNNVSGSSAPPTQFISYPIVEINGVARVAKTR